MYFARQEICFYILITSLALDFSWSWPVIKPSTQDKEEAPAAHLKGTRFPRQIVQPKWLNPVQQAAIDPIVHVTAKALNEADRIRKTIQKAVEEDSYVVTGEEPIAKEFVQPITANPLTFWHLGIQKLWRKLSQNLFPGFHN